MTDQSTTTPTRTIHTFAREQIIARVDLRAKAKAKREQLKALKKQAWQVIRDFKTNNRNISAELHKAISVSDGTICARFTRENVNPQRDAYQTYVCQYCSKSFQALPPRSGIRKFCTDAHRQAAYRDRASKRNAICNEETTIQ